MISPVMNTRHNTLMVMQLPATESRSISPLSTSPSREIRGIKLFRAISRKLARRSRDDSCDADSRSSSTDSCSSTSAGSCSKPKKFNEPGFRSSSPPQMSSSSSETGSDTQSAKHRHSISVESFRKVFQSLTINNTSRSQSCSSGKEAKRKPAKKSAPKRILRSPVTYTYVRGLSGLPTQRIVRTQPRIYINGACGCSMQYMVGLNR